MSGSCDARSSCHRDPVGLVLGVLLVPVGLLRPVPGDRAQVRGVLAEHLPQHGHEPVDRVGGLAGGGREPLDRVVGAMDVRHRVHQVELPGLFGHGRRISIVAFAGDLPLVILSAAKDLPCNASSRSPEAERSFASRRCREARADGSEGARMRHRPSVASPQPLRCRSIEEDEDRREKKTRDPFPESRD